MDSSNVHLIACTVHCDACLGHNCPSGSRRPCAVIGGLRERVCFSSYCLKERLLDIDVVRMDSVVGAWDSRRLLVASSSRQ